MKKLLIAVVVLLSFPAVTFAQGYDEYVVQKGDTLWKIAVRYQIGFQNILDANPLPNHNLIYPGQKIKIPNIDNIKAIENEVIALTNQERAKNGLPPLKQNWELSRVARYKSQDMSDLNYFSHTSPTYGTPFKMIENFGISSSAAAENIAKGQRTAAEVVKSWMNSSGHRANILNGTYTEIGVGYDADGNYWTQMFIKK
nr:CAP domain-containing protein [Lysinibacillus timonensis]